MLSSFLLWSDLFHESFQDPIQSLLRTLVINADTRIMEKERLKMNGEGYYNWSGKIIIAAVITDNQPHLCDGKNKRYSFVKLSF